MGLSPLFVTHVLEPYDLPLTYLGSVETIAIHRRSERAFDHVRGHAQSASSDSGDEQRAYCLPGKWLAKMAEPSARAIVGKCGQLCASLSALANFHRRVWAAHLSLHPAGMRGVHFDFAVAQFVG